VVYWIVVAFDKIIVYNIFMGRIKGSKLTEEHKKHISQGSKGRVYHKTHGENAKNSQEYSSWAAMKTRCYNPKTIGWRIYGGRGIKVCSEWLNSYEQFLKDMGRKPNRKYSLDRINSDGDYSEGNCRWATRQEQNSNRRTTYLFKGKNASEWARELGLTRQALINRLNKGFPYDLAVVTPKYYIAGKGLTRVVHFINE